MLDIGVSIEAAESQTESCLPTTYEVRGAVMFSLVSVILSTEVSARRKGGQIQVRGVDKGSGPTWEMGAESKAGAQVKSRQGEGGCGSGSRRGVGD